MHFSAFSFRDAVATLTQVLLIGTSSRHSCSANLANTPHGHQFKTILVEVELSVVVRVMVEEVYKRDHHCLLEDVLLLSIREAVGHHEGDQLLEKLLAMKCLPAWTVGRETRNPILLIN